MPGRKIVFSLLSAFAFLAVAASFTISQNTSQTAKIIFLNVGQGDAILISQGSKQILIDGGKNGNLLLEKLGTYIPFWDRKIEVIVATHPDADHIEGLIEALRRYKVEKIIKTEDESDSQAFKLFKELIAEEKAEVVDGVKGTSFGLSDEAKGEIIYPYSAEKQENSNLDSIVIELKMGNEKFLLTGDLPQEGEKQLIASGADLKSDYLKVSHHGSKYSTSIEFLEKINPKEAIISVGKNSYGHPNKETLDKLLGKSIQILRTDEKGDIIFECLKNLACQQLEN